MKNWLILMYIKFPDYLGLDTKIITFPQLIGEFSVQVPNKLEIKLLIHADIEAS